MSMPSAGRYPTFDFWLFEFDQFVEKANIIRQPFEAQLQQFLSVDIYESHKENIVLGAHGMMLASRTMLAYDNHDYEDVKESVHALELQEEISAAQPANRGRKNWAFFTGEADYYIWEFYMVSPEELVMMTILGTVSVSTLALLVIAHWPAAFWVSLMLVMLYIDLLGFIQLCGISVGLIMYISMVMSIGT